MAEKKQYAESDFDELREAAIRALDIALADGARKFPPRNWKGVSLYDHLMHARDHAIVARRQLFSKRWLRVHLTHLVCRAVMAYALFEETEKNS